MIGPFLRKKNKAMSQKRLCIKWPNSRFRIHMKIEREVSDPQQTAQTQNGHSAPGVKRVSEWTSWNH